MRDEYPFLKKYTSPVKLPERKIVGRDLEMQRVLAAMMRPELCNVILLAEAGSGKTALVQGISELDTNRRYLEVDLSKMIAEVADANQMADLLKSLFLEVQQFVMDEGHEVVLFMDEFHQVVQLSAATVEALKPLLADSGTRGIRVITATTFVEFREWIAPNQPLVERLQRINLEEPSKKMVVNILKDMAKRYHVDKDVCGDGLYEVIYDYTNRYIPANAQPRKSILVFDAMVGWHRFNDRPLNMKLLCDVIYESEGVNIAFQVDATRIKKTLDEHVFAQNLATTAIAKRLQICVADLNNKNKPMSSFLFTGSTGVGKSEMTKQLGEILFGANSRNVHTFDMTEYANDNSLERFKNELTGCIWERPYSILLLDEIEKACSPVTRLLLQVLDEGRLSDKNGREVSFTNTYIIMTTNAGEEIYNEIGKYDTDDMDSMLQKSMKLIRESITSTTGGNRFPPELLGRIDCIVPFQPLSRDTLKKIVNNKLVKLQQEVQAKYRRSLRVQSNVVDYLIEDTISTDTNAGGARNAISKMEDEVTSKVAQYLNESKNSSDSVYVVRTGASAYEDKSILESRVQIHVCNEADAHRLIENDRRRLRI